MSDPIAMRPAVVCGYLLAALDAADGRRRRRKRDTTPDAIGMEMKRQLLEAAVREDPAPDGFESWLLTRALTASDASGPVRSMALAVLAEYRLAADSPVFAAWLTSGAPSDDAASH